MIPIYEKIILILIEAVGSGILTMIPLDNKSEVPMSQLGKLEMKQACLGYAIL